MKLRYILGRVGTGKTHLIFNEIKKRLEEGGENKLILLVPEQFTLQTEYDLIAKTDIHGIMRVEVLSFERLAYKVFSEVGGLKKIDIDELGKIMVLRRLFDKYSYKLKLYQKAFKQQGFLSNFCSLISEFKRNDISPELIRESLVSFDEDIILKKKLEDISFIYEKFNNYMDGRYTDEEDKFNMLIEKIGEAKFLNSAEVWIDEFSGFTSQEYKVLEKILLNAKKVNIALTIDTNKDVKDKDLFMPTNETFKKLREIANRYGIKETKTDLNKKQNELIHKSEDLRHLEREIYAFPYRKYRKRPESIEIFSGTNQYTEIENAAIKILSLVRDKGYRWKDIALVTGAMDVYGPIIKRVFSEYGVPYFLDEKRSIMNNPIVKLILSSLDALYRNFKYEDVFRFVKTGFCNIDKEEIEKLENYVLRWGIEGNKWFEEFIYEDEDIETINQIRKKFIKPFENIKTKLKKKSTVEEISTYLFEFLQELNIEEKLDDWIDKLREEGRLEYVNENTQIWNILIKIFDQLVEILGDTKVNLREYRKILEAGFSQYEVGIIPPTIDQVLIGNLERSKSHEIKALFVVGVNDGILPSSFKDEGLLVDEEKLIIKNMGLPIYSDSETKIREEQFSIYTALSKPKEYLWISYALSDIEGRALRPSILIDRFKKLYPKLIIKSDIPKTVEEDKKRQKSLVSTKIATFKYLIENLRRKVDGNNIYDLWYEVYDWYFNNDDWKDKLDMVIEGLFHNNQEGYIGEEKARSLYNVPFKSSISRFEKFVNCPFAHFINFGLKPQERKEYKIKTPDLGRLFHASMEKFAKTLKLEDLSWRELNREKCDEIVEKIIDEITPQFENNILSSSYRYKYLINKLKRISKRAVWTLTEHIKKGDFKPSFYEFGFGDDLYSNAPPIIIELPNGEQIKIEGRIDRIDILEGDKRSYVKVIDYKSGNKKFSLSDVYYGLQIQLIVYLDAVLINKDKLMVNEAYPGGVFYFKLDDPMVESDGNDIEAIEKEIMKKLKMDGIIIKDINIAKAMDRDLEDEKNSSVIPVSLKKDGNFTKYSSVLEDEDMYNLIKHVRNLIIEIAGEILKGNIKIEPCKIDNRIYCEYCEYACICQFDKNFDNNNYRIIRKLSDEEVIKKIRDEIRGDLNAKMD
ncbi:helicase-exonuclease AddAB subunit AddB [Caminicella sporogenes]|uniref:helicase-exonuclease AddAB subunit AddB n=1 Tax=Caminicella sporogenes TaxID=166485 RepID=UPI0025420E68|nr:helicase-exonuclease AddAB subunit AddB [Caminicella sporogenes]WIF95357.1 helicase-exonuclease AddAB subunit AddB [Caminicella sporogenes]